MPNFSTKEKALLSRLAGKGGLNAQEGTVGGWTITDTKLKSSGENIARIELDKTSVKICLYDAHNNEILRIGTDDTDRGLFIYDTDGNQLARYVSDEIFVGEATKYIKYTAAGGVEIAGAISASTIDIGGADATSFHVDADGNMWSGAATYASGVFKVSSAGALAASSVAITGGTLDIGGADATSFHVDANGNIWSGAAAYASGPFRVSSAGALVATSATITGVITANTGYIGGTSGWTIASGKLTASGIGMATATGDATYAFWAGNNTPASAEFSVTHAGALQATSATIVGDIKTATSGQRIHIDGTNNRILVYNSAGTLQMGVADAIGTQIAWFGDDGNTVPAIRAWGGTSSGVMGYGDTYGVYGYSSGYGLFSQGNVGIAGELSVNAGSPSVYLDVSASDSGAYLAELFNTHSAGHGLWIKAGSTSSHYAFTVQTYNGTTLAYVLGDGTTYFKGNVDADSYTEHTPFYEGDAIAEIMKIKAKDGQIDHDTLPPFVRGIHHRDIQGMVDLQEVKLKDALELKSITRDKVVDGQKVVKEKKTKTHSYKIADDGKLKPNVAMEEVYEQETVTIPQPKEGIYFDKETGKFYLKLNEGAVYHENGRAQQLTVTGSEDTPTRNLGGMISMLTVAVQQLTSRLETLEGSIAI